MARKQGSPAGEDVESVLARADDWLARGDLENAAREVNSLKGWAKRLATDWLEDVRKVCAVRMAVDVSIESFSFCVVPRVLVYLSNFYPFLLSFLLFIEWQR